MISASDIRLKNIAVALVDEKSAVVGGVRFLISFAAMTRLASVMLINDFDNFCKKCTR